ncbi:MAG: DUF4198 domain-containing protein [Desulfotalea sp.]
MQIKTIGAATCLTVFSALPSHAHFGMLISDHSIINQENRASNLQLSFSHPFEGIGMVLEKPEKFNLTLAGKNTDLTADLKQNMVMGKESWNLDYKFARPGVYIFSMEPKPYWEPSENVSIIHYTKTIVPAYGADTGWDEPVGLPAEIIPLTRPYGNYAGNSFTGKVLVNGKPLAMADVEVEFYNKDNNYKAPSEYHVTQVVKADKNGIFTFTCPQAGWWGFSALTEASYTLKDPNGEDKGVEIGAVLWTYMSEINNK